MIGVSIKISVDGLQLEWCDPQLQGKKMEDLCPTSHNLEVPFARSPWWIVFHMEK